MKDVIIVTGPTASGKSGLAMELANHIDCELISADSMQIYRGMDIGTAKPSPDERARVKHHLIDIVDINEDYSAAQFQSQAFNLIDELHKKGKTPVVVGGTGLYINSLIYRLDFTNTPANEAFRKKMMILSETHGPEYLHHILEEKDAEAANRIHKNDEKRIIRRLEILAHESAGAYDFESPRDDYCFHIFGMQLARDVLYDRINQRVDHMVHIGLFDEVSALYSRYGDTYSAMKAIGYKEIISCIKGEIEKEEAIERVKQHSRQFAKRQITWFKRDKRIIWLDAQENKCLKTILNGLK